MEFACFGAFPTQIFLEQVDLLCFPVHRYASLYFVACIEKEDNELIVLDIIHHFVEVLDRYFSNVCELDLIFNFHQAYFILEEMIIGGYIMESSKK